MSTWPQRAVWICRLCDATSIKPTDRATAWSQLYAHLAEAHPTEGTST